MPAPFASIVSRVGVKPILWLLGRVPARVDAQLNVRAGVATDPSLLARDDETLGQLTDRLERLESKLDRVLWLALGILGVTVATLVVAIINNS